jgi:O-antigen ligase
MRDADTLTNPWTRANIVIFGLFLAVVILFGGASRADVMSLPFVRLAAILTIVIFALQLKSSQLHQIRLPLAFLAAIALLIGVQLIPLPPGWWAALPGHARFADNLASAGITPGWRPASLTPDLTLNSLLAVLPPLAVVLASAMINRSYHARLLVPLLLIGIVISALLGLLQVSGGYPYFYTITNADSAVGFFANRNHLALFIAIALPLVACWAAMPHADAAYRRMRFWIFLCVAAAVFPLLLITGSRAGLIIAVVGLLTMAGFKDPSAGTHSPRAYRRGWRIWAIPVAVGLGAVLSVVFMSRGLALERLLGGESSGARLENLPRYFHMVRDFFPLGSGLGSFDPIYRSYEPISSITPEYLNQAHNDIVQIVIEAGAPALLLLVAFLGWFALRSWRLWSRRIESTDTLLGRAGSVIVLLILLSSFVDYPLRTPVIEAVMALACYWMTPGSRTREGRHPNGGVGTSAGIG